MDTRQQKGLVLAKGARHIAGSTWTVPSQSNEAGAYSVDADKATCTCPDFELRRQRCKHLFAVEFSRTVETASDGTTTVTEKVTVTRKTYVQDWPNYNAAQVAEKDTVQDLLRGLCDGIHTPAHPGRGRKPISLSDAAYAMTMKVYTTMSARRASTDIKACAESGKLSRAVSFSSVLDYFDNPAMTPVLIRLIEESAKPLASIETSFAIDSTGFGTHVYRRWYDAKYGKEMAESVWLKAHVVTGVTTNIVTSVNVTDSASHDSPQLPALLSSTAQRFQIAEMSGDKGYLSNANLTAIEAVGAVPFVPFKSNSKGEGSPAWRRMWAHFLMRQEDFLAHYHKRSNVESTFSAIKRKFGGAVRSKRFVAQRNEILCKLICHNLSVLVHAMHELGIQPSFATASQVA
ncbi:MAG TPA: transposase [Polyangia bacterium]|nr:transposase [Polyangia bacterium]